MSPGIRHSPIKTVVFICTANYYRKGAKIVAVCGIRLRPSCCATTRLLTYSA